MKKDFENVLSVTTPSTEKTEPASAKPGKKASPRSANRAAEVLDALRRRISRYEVTPGSNLREQELAQEFGVPRTLIREVFSALEQRGLIRRVPNHGAIVARLEVSQMFQIYDIREVIEALTVRLATLNADPDSWQPMLEYFEGPMKQYVADENYDAYLAGYEDFRLKILAAADNPALTETVENYWDKTRVLVGRLVILPGRALQGLGEHTEVLRAMRNNDAYKAEELRRESMRNSKAALVKFHKYLVL
ncbi:GntR family transcriptional regulator [Yanghanlia caeni]|uniref:GntR family transcriptional regulator n=1 Tax=Yanghanlia caeni TaxID=3064283 RepID=A0ABU1D9L9_9BURK|nr:GntR family transcriptional regulator [Alcaligenaceae bacterium LG-2]